MRSLENLHGGVGKLLVEKPEPTMPAFSPLLRQILASSGALILTISSGMTSGYSAILLPQLEQANSTIKPTAEESSWIASMAALPMAMGCILSGILLERVGRKMTQILSALPYIVGWALIGASTNVGMILVGRFLTGLSVGLIGPVGSVYIAETSAPKYRGFLLSGISFAVAFGLFLSHLLGTFLSWQLVAYISVVLPIISVGLFVLVPESPTWLVNRGKFKKAERAFVWCRGYSTEAKEELAAMLQKESTFGQQEKLSWSQCKQVEFWKPFLIMNVFFVTTQFAGVNAIAFYSVSIMQSAVGEGMDKYTATMIIDTIRLVMSIAAGILNKKFARRVLTNISTIGTAISLIALAVFLYMVKIYPEVANYSFIPVSCLVGFILFSSGGLVPVPWIMVGEVFPRSLKGVGSAVTTSMNFLALFLVVKTCPAMTLYLQMYGTFLIYGCSTVIGGIFLYIYLPETKGKTLQQIEERFKNHGKLSSIAPL